MNILRNLWKPLAYIVLIILIAASLSRVLSKSQTLSDYASNHPEEQSENIEAMTKHHSGEQSENIETTTKSHSDEQNENNEASSEYSTEKNKQEDTIVMNTFKDEYSDSDLRITYAEQFFYEPVPEYIKNKICGISFPEDASISLDELSYLSLKYIDFNGESQTGEMICNKAIAQDVIEIFHELYKAGYQIEKIKLIDDYQGDDELSMLDNNTSSFNYRTIAGTNRLSNHAKGLAIDINPYYNPYVTYSDGTEHVAPAGADKYADRNNSFAYKIDENDLCYKLFINHGFTWGGNWNSSKDYQHFEKATK